MKEAIIKLRSFYFAIVGPGILLLLLGGVYEHQHSFGFSFPGRWFSFLVLGVILVLAYIIPMWMRLIKIRNVNNRQDFGLENLITFEKSILLLTGLSIYIAPLAFIFAFPDFPKFAVAFAAIYALYVAYPSERRLKLDKKVFKVHDLK
jgi:hypothetical protein